MNKVTVISLSGEKGSGKTSICNELVERLNYEGIFSIRISFADGIRELISKEFDIPMEILTTRELKDNLRLKYDSKHTSWFRFFEDKEDKTYSDVMEAWGEGIREEYPSHWADKFKEKILNLNRDVVVLTDDARNEYDFGAVRSYHHYLFTLINGLGETHQGEPSKQMRRYIKQHEDMFIKSIVSVPVNSRDYDSFNRNVLSLLHGDRYGNL